MTYHWTINGKPSCDCKPFEKTQRLYNNINIMTGCSSESLSEVTEWATLWGMEFPEDNVAIVPNECPSYLASDSYGDENV